LPELPGLVDAYAAGGSDVQRAFLDEFEPLVFGYARSYARGADAHARAVRQTHELVLAFHLRACAGRARIASVPDMKRQAHELALAKRDGFLAGLADFGDPETGAFGPRAPEVGALLQRSLDAAQLDLLEQALLGAVPAPSAWLPLKDRLLRLGVLR